MAKRKAKIHEAQRLNLPRNAERFALFSVLKGELATLATTHEEHAYNIMHLTGLSTHEARLQKRAPYLLWIALDDVSTLV